MCITSLVMIFNCLQQPVADSQVDESVRCPHINMNPITWQQVEQTTKMLREATITAPTAEVQVRGV